MVSEVVLLDSSGGDLQLSESRRTLQEKGVEPFLDGGGKAGCFHE